jgi:hypothetical protein
MHFFCILVIIVEIKGGKLSKWVQTKNADFHSLIFQTVQDVLLVMVSWFYSFWAHKHDMCYISHPVINYAVLYSPFKIQVCTSKVSPRTTPIGPGKYVLRGRNAYRITDGNNLTSQFNVGMSMDIHGCSNICVAPLIKYDIRIHFISVRISPSG